MQRHPDPVVVAWLDRQPAESVWTTSVTVFEGRFGIDLMATRHRQRELERALAAALEEDLDGRVAPFDLAAALAAGTIAATRRRAGRPVDIRNLQIAGIAQARKATLATRNARHFEGLALSPVDPWSA